MSLSFDLKPEEIFETPEAPPISQKAAARQLRKKYKEDRQSRRTPKPVIPRTRNQSRYIRSLRHNPLTFGVGPAGTGKTYVASRVYGEMLMEGLIDVVYCARPNISKPQHRNGFLPGNEREKCAPWMVPIFDGLRDAMSPAKFNDAQRNGQIKEVPYEFMQGRTFRDCAAIIDEAENCDIDDLYITLTRQGDNCFMAICGDPVQSRIPRSGLKIVVEMSQYDYMKGVGVVEFTFEDVIRSGQARQWVRAFGDRNTVEILRDQHKRGMNSEEDFRNNLPDFLKGR